MAEDAGPEWQGEIILDHREEPARLLFLVVAIDSGLLDQLVQLPRGCDDAVGSFSVAHHVSSPKLFGGRKCPLSKVIRAAGPSGISRQLGNGNGGARSVGSVESRGDAVIAHIFLS